MGIFRALRVLLFLFCIQLQLCSHEPKICLTMIVKNESAVILRCLESVLGVIDCISICDTGSTDDTVAIIENFMRKHHLPGRVYQHQWRNFGFNRTESFKAASETLLKEGYEPADTYLLLLDADMTLVCQPKFKKHELKLDGYCLRQRLQTLEYDNIRLIRSSLPWICVGATHEYWQCQKHASYGKLTTLEIDDHGDGGSRDDKFIRDEKLLIEALQQDPSDMRAMFYLAGTYHCLKEYEKALFWYEKRIEQGGWDEEVWFSKFMIGTIYEELGVWEKALSTYLESYQYRPTRAEPLYRVAKHFRLKGKNDLAYLFAMQAARIPYPSDILFIEHPVYEYQIDEELSIAAYYTLFQEEGFSANERLMFNKKAPALQQDQAAYNAYFYVSKLKNTTCTRIDFERPYINEKLAIQYNGMNPSICTVEGGYLVACRCVNFTQTAGQYTMLDPTAEFLIKTRNFLLYYDKNFKLIWQKEIIDTHLAAHQRPPYGSIEGIEDIRLFPYKNSFWFTGTVLDTNAYHIPQMGLFQLGEITKEKDIYTAHGAVLQGPQPQRCEKNWMPFVKDGALCAIYSYDPFVIYKIDEQSGACKEVFHSEQKYNFSSFRGSAPPIAFDEGYLMLVHQVILKDSERIYLHRFVELDSHYQIKRVSKPFTYMHRGVEYCCGLAMSHEGSSLIMTVGIENAQPFFVSVDLASVRKELEAGLKL